MFQFLLMPPSILFLECRTQAANLVQYGIPKNLDNFYRLTCAVDTHPEPARRGEDTQEPAQYSKDRNLFFGIVSNLFETGRLASNHTYQSRISFIIDCTSE